MPNVPEEVMANVVWGKPRDGHSAQKLALMRAALSALEAAGWAVVPKVPTIAMQEAVARIPIRVGLKRPAHIPTAYVKEILSAMLTASRKERP